MNPVRHVAVVGVHIAVDVRLGVGHALASRHKVGDFLSGLFAHAEISRDGTRDQHGEVVADRHGVHPLRGDEDHRQPAPLGLVDVAQDVGRLFHTQRGSRFVKDQHPASKGTARAMARLWRSLPDRPPASRSPS
ncbi:hypothetical protein [Sagittula salina]|uniref:Uncharacterized protein n=1 Tax=Sagittula salina TaxID=2820268 RepID=A0A940S5B4_9RHOB|nr:hypothetical protein [Sagittula salina]MBP0484805.1 hypothetical protein [Sagittula salina]